MASEWLRIMLDEIARKRDDARRAQEEEQRRLQERADSGDKPAVDAANRKTPEIS
jgi:hypothetical protein